MADTEPVLYNYQDFSARFPLPKCSDTTWAMLLLRFRDRGDLTEGKHYKRKWYGTLRYVYSIPAVVSVICRKAKLHDRPLPNCVYLLETYYDEFCTILTDHQAAKVAHKEQA